MAYSAGRISREVLVLQHAPCESPGAIQDVLENAGHGLRFIRTFAGEPVPQEPDEQIAGLVVMGGPMGVYEQDIYPFLQDELRLIEACLAAGLPVLGTCLGSQLLAAALGAPVKKGRKKEIGWHPVRLTEAASADSLFASAPRDFTPLHWHGDVFDLPAGAVSIASSELTACQGFRHGGNVYGLLFHMEVNAAILNGMVETFAQELQEEKVSGAGILADATTHLPALRQIAGSVYRRWTGLLLV
ncbi:MAG: gamma-glutamyl-gamma-aminobutyrate hydrolase family protein [Acidobacteriota bacterium]